MELIENIKKYGNKDKNYVPHEYATCYPLHSQDFVRTGFQDISYTLASRDYKDPKCVIVKASDEMIYKTIVAMRGRNPNNPSDRTVGAPTEQRLEPNSQGICNTLTSVQKDNLVMETVRIKQDTSQGYIECEVGGVADLSFPDSKTRRGRVQENGQVSPTLMAGEQDICRIEPVLVGGFGEKKSNGGTQYYQQDRVYSMDGVAMCHPSQIPDGSYKYLDEQYRIRKLTPKECWSLMNFSEEDFIKAAQVNSNTQLYKQAGNSIVKNVLLAILGQMIPGKEDVYREIQK